MDAYHPDTLCGTVLDASWPVSAVPGTQRGPKGALDQKISILARWKIFNGIPSPSFSQFIIDPKMSLTCDMSQIWTDVFEKNALFCIPYLGQKRPFFGPEGPILTQNLKNIVKQVVITQNNAFQGLKWPPSNNVIFGVCRPPQIPPEPPQTPPMVQGGQNWPKCTCTSPMLIINDKKTTFKGVNILTYFFTRNAPSAFFTCRCHGWQHTDMLRPSV